MTKEQIERLESHAKAMIADKKVIETNMNTLIRECQKLGYSVSPKTGKVKKL